MKSHQRFINTIGLMAMFMFGCAVGQGLNIKSGEVADAVMSVPLSDSDLSAVSAAFGDFGLSRQALEDLADKPVDINTDLALLQVEHARVQVAFVALQSVVKANWDIYGLADQAKMKSWESQFRQLEDTYAALALSAQSPIATADREAAKLEMLNILTQIAVLVA